MDSLTATDLRTVGEFRLLARLGSGGMGQVFLASSLAGRIVAVKVIHAELCRDAEFVRRFRHEVEAAQKVSGWYTAPVVAAGPVRAARARAGGRPLFVLDLGMPPDVDAAVGGLPGVTLVDLTALGRHLADRAVPDQVPQVRAIVAAEAAAYMERRGQTAAAPVIAAMHAQITQLADAELARLQHRLPYLSEAQRAETAATVHRILRKVLHRPTVRAKEFSTGPDGPVYLDALRQLFELTTDEART